MVDDDVMTLAEAARELGIPYPTLYYYQMRGAFVSESQQGYLWVRLSEVAEAMKDYKRRNQKRSRIPQPFNLSL